MSVVKFKSIFKSFNGKKVLKNINFEIEKGERVVFFGPSGCGKTTILRLIAGFIPPDEGEIFIKEKLVSKGGKILVEPESRNVGMVFQDLALWPHLSVKGNIELGLKAKGISKVERDKKIKDVLSLVGLNGYENRMPSELSGGEKQRVALSRSLVLNPDILLMDEPLTNLDFELNERLRKEIVQIQEKLRFTLIYVTHNKDELSYIATKIVYLKNGEIVKIE